MGSFIDLAFFTIGENYLHTVKNILSENLKDGNKWVVMYSEQKIDEISNEDYEADTKRSDFNVFIPTIFLLYHGLELVLKGLLKLDGQTFEANHKISLLYEKTKDNKENLEFIDVVRKYIEKDQMIHLIGNFLSKNNKNIDSFYEIFRYPSNKDEKELYKYFELKYNEDVGIIFSRQVIEDIDFIRKWIVLKYRKNNKEQNTL